MSEKISERDEFKLKKTAREARPWVFWVGRIGYAAMAVVHLLVGFLAMLSVFGAASAIGTRGALRQIGELPFGQTLLAAVAVGLLAQPFGRWLVGLAALVTAGIGIFQFYQATTAQFRETMRLTEMSAKQAIWGTRVGRCGFAARGIVFCIVGFFLFFAAVNSDAAETRSFGGALDALARQPYGAWLLAIVAFGLFFYGVFMIYLARFRRMVGD